MTALQDLRKRLEPQLRHLFHLYWRFARGLTMGVRAAVLDDAGRVFLIRHTYVPGWHLPGGAVEAGEAVGEAVVREVREECAIAISGTPDLFGLYFNRVASRRDHVAVYRARTFEVLGQREADLEIIGAEFYPVDRLPESTTSATRASSDPSPPRPS